MRVLTTRRQKDDKVAALLVLYKIYLLSKVDLINSDKKIDQKEYDSYLMSQQSRIAFISRS